MNKALKHTSMWPRAVVNAALNPHHFLSGIRYRLQGLRTPPAKLLPAGAQDSLFPEIRSGNTNFRQLSFTFSAIALSAKVACADGKLTREKYIAFRDSFPLNGEVCGKIRSLFILACRNETPFWHYVAQVKYMFPDRPELFITLVDRLFRIATADGLLSRTSEQLLCCIAHQLHISAADYGDMYRHYNHPANVTDRKQAQHVMGIEKRLEAAGLKKRYHELMHRYHPDRFASQDVSQEVQMLLQLKTSEINMAYQALRAG